MKTYIPIILIVIAIVCIQVFYKGEPEVPVEPPKHGVIYMNGKVVPLTKLSEEDSKRPCAECHTK